MSTTQEADDLLTLQEAADALAVHYMTAYRWVRRGDLPAVEVDGRLQVRRAELDRYLESRRAGAGPASAAGGRRDWGGHVDRMVEALVRGDSAACNGVVRDVIGDGATAGEVYTQLLTPAVHQVSQVAGAGEAADAALEHRTTEICSGIMTRLSEHFRRRGPRRGVAVTLTAPGETHGVATAMIADFLRASGWEVHHLGTDVPVEDLELFLDLVPADVVCVSAATELRPQVYEQLARACGDRQLIMGGRGTDLAIAEPLGVTVLDDPIDLVEHLDEAFSPPQPLRSP